jgi:hypothetical protein
MELTYLSSILVAAPGTQNRSAPILTNLRENLGISRVAEVARILL